MLDLSTTYLGLNLKNPLVPSSSPLSHDIDAVLHLEDAGAAAIVMHSPFAKPPGTCLTRMTTRADLTTIWNKSSSSSRALPSRLWPA